MKKLIVFPLLFLMSFCTKDYSREDLCNCETSYLSNTWVGTASNQLVTIAAWNNFLPSYPISGTSTKCITKGDLIAAGVPSGYYSNAPISGFSNSKCPTKQNILDTQ